MKGEFFGKRKKLPFFQKNSQYMYKIFPHSN